ncbi:hypothetical protein N7474_006952 [Penicillium riverlandense]|uniref:uncharacterized protein n=1 Tax=Penicillium riverlandense TaxID=1903569 RepID=UPI0025472B33|nr:uncharacterized protein N7474_006952 [Penicillium riverlandense]KAJ5815175.1 hypothetical protein N7474_006952 [Penicillium riverlandense]
MALAQTIIQQHGDVASKPSRVFGKGKVILRIGNGGAGATGLIESLALDYLSLKGITGSIEWICNHSRNTQLALFNGYIDIALTYEREQENIAVSEGWAESAGCIFHDHFCLVGPEHDPANVRHAKSIEEAFERIHSTKSLFHSRSDGSATMSKERDIWRRCHRFPWNEKSEWYVQTEYNPADAVSIATASGAYLLNDRSTLLYQVGHGAAANCTVFFEPTDPFHPLMNSCYALHAPLSTPGLKKECSLFIDYLKSRRGQDVIAKYGVDKAGVQLFAPVEQGIAETRLVGGRVINGRWVAGRQPSKL